MKDERITIIVRTGRPGSVCIDSDREICGYKHTVFTYGIKLKYDEVTRNSFIYRWSHHWSLPYFTKGNDNEKDGKIKNMFLLRK